MNSSTLKSEILALVQFGGRLAERPFTTTDVEQLLSESVARHRVRYVIDGLREAGVLVIQGTKRGSHYVLAQLPQVPAIPQPGVVLKAHGVISSQGKTTLGQAGFNQEALRVVNLMEIPVLQRGPKVNFDPDFLESYIPGETFYLGDSLRSHLQYLGKTGEAPRPAGTHARQVLQRLTLDLAWNSSRLEGNTYSLLETKALLDHNEAPQLRTDEETQMILNHKEAITFLVEQVDSQDPGVLLSKWKINNLHGILMDGLLAPEQIGSIRQIPVEIGESRYLPINIPQVLDEQLGMILKKAMAIEDPFERSFFLLAHIPYLQPYRDGNKRMGRMTANIPLIQNNLCPLGFVGVDEKSLKTGHMAVYEMQNISVLRDVFEWAYRESSRRYTVLQEAQPDPMRMHYRQPLREVVKLIVDKGLHSSAASAAVRAYAKANIPEMDQEKFQGVTEGEILALHEGNIARFRLSLAEFTAWKQ